MNEVIDAALRQDHPDATPAQIADTAYALGVQESALALAAQLR